jgi:hypothetical protein
MSGSQHHQSHDAFAIYFFAIFFHTNFAGKTVRYFYKLRRRASVDAKFVLDGKIACDSHVGGERVGRNANRWKAKNFVSCGED